MISETAKLGIAMDLIEEKIAKYMMDKKDEKTNDEELKELINTRDEIYKGNYEVINEIINERMEKK